MATLLKIHENHKEFKESGSCLDAIRWNDDGTFKERAGHEPIVGCSFFIGNVTARSYSNQDYWLTTEVTEIIERTDDFVLFRTKNSLYKLLR